MGVVPLRLPLPQRAETSHMISRTARMALVRPRAAPPPAGQSSPPRRLRLWRRAASSHPEDRLREARRRALEAMGIGPGTGSAEGVAAAAQGSPSQAPDPPAETVPVCAANGHPQHRLRLARQRVLEGMEEGRGGTLAEALPAADAPEERRRRQSVSLSRLLSSRSSLRPSRPSDGSSSGAVASDRLSRARSAAIDRLLLASSENGRQGGQA